MVENILKNTLRSCDLEKIVSILTSRKDVQTGSVSVLMFCLKILLMFGVNQFQIFVCFSTDQCFEACVTTGREGNYDRECTGAYHSASLQAIRRRLVACPCLRRQCTSLQRACRHRRNHLQAIGLGRSLARYLMGMPGLTKRLDSGDVVLCKLGRLILRCVMDSEPFPELLVLNHLSDGRNRSLRAILPPLERRFLQVGSGIDPNSFIPDEPSSQSPLEISSKGTIIRLVAISATELNSRLPGRTVQTNWRFQIR